jgi:predicted outer membrane repeat protein
VTIQSSTLSGNSSYRGGAVYTSDGTVDITNSALTTNTASGEGAGIYMEFGVLTILRSTLADNSADGNGGGIYTNGTFSIQSSTLSGNTAWGSGGGILNSGGEGTIVNSTLNGNSVAEFYGGAIFNAGPMTISNSTISDNHAAGSGGIYQDPYPGSPLTLKNSIVALNTSASHFSDITGPFTGNFNFIGTDHPGVDPKLGPLANNGGPTKTMALLPGSPCLNAGDPAFSGLDFDQRGPGYGRVVFSRIDIGAYELQTPKRRIEDLINRVKELGDHEDDNREHGDELVNPLEGALRKLSRNEKGPTQAAKLLESFIKQIEQQIKGLRTSDSDYASDLAEVTGLKTEAQSIIEQLLAA